MSNFKSPELIINGKIVKVVDTSNNQVKMLSFRSVASIPKLKCFREINGSYSQDKKNFKASSQKLSIG